MEIGEIAKSCFVLAENNIFSWFRHGRFSTVYPEAAWSPSPKKREIKVHTMVHFHALKAVSSIYRQEIMSDCVWNRSLRVWLLQPQAELRSKREKHTRIEMNVVVLHFRFQTITILNHYHCERLHEHRINCSWLLFGVIAHPSPDRRCGVGSHDLP